MVEKKEAEKAQKIIDIKEISEKSAWEAHLAKCVNAPFFTQSWEWGEMKKSAGWEVKRLAFVECGNFLGVIQIFIKTKFGLKVAWSNGGVGFVNVAVLPKILESIKKLNLTYHRISFFDFENADLEFEFLLLSKWLKKAPCAINSYFTSIHENVDFTLNANHRYYLKQAQKSGLKVEESANLEAFEKLHREMADAKNLDALSSDALENFKEAFKGQFCVFSVYESAKGAESKETNRTDSVQTTESKDANKTDSYPIASAIVLIKQNRAYYHLAASNEQGRRKYASYLMVAFMLEALKNRGVEHFNFMGLTPFKADALGVNKFKLGFGGEVKKYLGEWEITPNNLFQKCVAWGVNLALFLRGRA